jgi:hypothetical protein
LKLSGLPAAVLKRDYNANSEAQKGAVLIGYSTVLPIALYKTTTKDGERAPREFVLYNVKVVGSVVL